MRIKSVLKQVFLTEEENKKLKDIGKLKLLFLNFYFLNLSPYHHPIYI